MILYGIHYSPWSLRARWALQHHAVEHEYREYLSMIDTPWVRLRLRDFRNPITVPILIDGSTILRDSLDIARHADALGTAEPLFSDGSETVVAWTETANQIAQAGRIVTTYTVLHDRDASRESIPKVLPRMLRPLSGPVVTLGAWHLGRKYAFEPADIDPALDRMRAGLERVANRLVDSETLGARFGWPDIVVASALQFVEPAPNWARLGPAASAAWTRPELVTEFADVLRWRDELLARHLP